MNKESAIDVHNSVKKEFRFLGYTEMKNLVRRCTIVDNPTFDYCGYVNKLQKEIFIEDGYDSPEFIEWIDLFFGTEEAHE